MGSKIEFVDSTQLYTAKYIRNARAVSVVWAIFSICYAVLVSVAFSTTEWIGSVDDHNDPNLSKIGLWSMCHRNTVNGEQTCVGSLDDFFISIPNIAFKIATICVAVSWLTAICTCGSMLLFCCCQSTTIFRMCGILQLVSGIILINHVNYT